MINKNNKKVWVSSYGTKQNLVNLQAKRPLMRSQNFAKMVNFLIVLVLKITYLLESILNEYR